MQPTAFGHGWYRALAFTRTAQPQQEVSVPESVSNLYYLLDSDEEPQRLERQARIYRVFARGGAEKELQ